MRIGIPVECQNGHKSTWVIRIGPGNGDGLEPVHEGAMDKCECPKWNLGQGWRASGEPFVLPTKPQPDKE